MPVDEREGHGWWPYAIPYIAYFVLIELGRRLPDAADPFMLALRPLVVIGSILWFRRRGAYPEWRRPPVAMTFGGLLQDVAVGLLLTAVWVLPYVWFPGLRPEPGGEFDPAIAGEGLVPLLLGLRLFGYGLVTPIFEELFIRSFVPRVADVWETENDFRDRPIALYTAKSLVVTTLLFTITHQLWEYWVCVPWILLSTLWFVRRRNLTALMVVHGVTNAALWVLAVFGDGWITDASGRPFSFWFFI